MGGLFGGGVLGEREYGASRGAGCVRRSLRLEARATLAGTEDSEGPDGIGSGWPLRSGRLEGFVTCWNTPVANAPCTRYCEEITCSAHSLRHIPENMSSILPEEFTRTHDLSDSDYLIVWAEQGLDMKSEVCIYGNPSGLRRLAHVLLGLADLDQTTVRMPDNETDHHHLRTGLNTEACDTMPGLRIGRVDRKLDGSRLNDGWPMRVVELGGKGMSDAYGSECHAVYPNWNCEE